MKKITRFGCSAIQYNQNFIAVAGNKIVLFDRFSQEQLHVFSNTTNTITLGMDDRYVYSRNTSGSYAAFDYVNDTLICKSKSRKLYDTSFDGKFSVSPSEHCIIDVLHMKDDCFHVVKFYPETKEYHSLKLLPTEEYFERTLWYDDNSKKAYVLFNETCCSDKPCTQSLLYVVNTAKMQIVEIIPIDYPHCINALHLLTPHKILSSDFMLTDLSAHKSEKINGVSDELFFANGFLRDIMLTEDKKIIFTCGKKVFIYNLATKSIENTISCTHGVTTKIIDGNFWIGTWEGVYIAEEKDICSYKL